MVLQRLIWKDARLVQPLVLAIVAAILVAPLLIAFSVAFSGMTTLSAAGVLIAFWMLFPNLVALGAPAMLIGTEEESGTMGWMRTIPVRWQSVATSKLVVSIGALLIAYLFASGVLWISSGWWPAFGNSTAAPFDLVYVSGLGLLMSIFFSVNLLLCGLVITSLMRSPVGGILLVVPAIIFLTAYSSHAIDVVLGTSSALVQNPDASPRQWMVVTLMIAAIWFSFVAVFYRLVKFRLTSTFVSPFRPGFLSRSQQAYHPPAAVTGLRRPSVTLALLWQQIRQVRTVIGVLLLMSLLCVWQAMDDVNSPLLATPILFLSWIGVMTFYGDSVRDRCEFFAQKGVSPTMVWWTRVLPTMVPAIVLLSLTTGVVLQPQSRQFQSVWFVATGVAMYCFGVFVSQWSLRPTLAFFGGPAITALCAMPLGLWFQLYPTYSPCFAAMGITVLFASWRLMRPWMDRRNDLPSKLITVGYSVLAVTVPVLITIGHRIATMPPAMTDWRESAMAMAGDPDQQPSFATFASLDRSLPKDELLRIVVAEWKRYQRTDWYDSAGQLSSKTFARTNIQAPPFAFERVRTDRNIDRVARVLIEQIESEQWFATGESREELLHAWAQTRLGGAADKRDRDWLLQWAFRLGQDHNP